MFIKNNKLAFTLVELIVVITILSILGTIAFISLQGYSKSTRDAVRISDMSNIAKQLEIKLTVGGKLPSPDNSINILASGSIITYQGEATESLLNDIGVHNGGIDPLTNRYYTYVTNTSLTSYQILGFLEESLSLSYNDFLFSKTHSVLDYSDKYPIVKGNLLGVFLSSGSLVPAQTFGQPIDFIKSEDTYVAYIDNTQDGNITGTGYELSEKIVSHSELELDDDLMEKLYMENNNFAKFDDSLIGYWDMETTINKNSSIYLENLSNKTSNDGVLNGVMSIGTVDGIIGKATYFDGLNDYINVGQLFSESVEAFTVSLYFKYDNVNQRASCTGDPNKYTPFLSSRNSYGYGSNEKGFRYGAVSNCYGTTRFWNSVQNINTGVGHSYDSLTHENFVTKYVDNQWRFITFVFDRGAQKIYINGVLVSASNSSLTDRLMTPGPSVFIGKTSVNGGYFPGLIDEVRVYNKALTDEEILNIYNQGNIY